MSGVHTKAVILSIGDELVLGQKLDTNSKWVSTRLSDLGVRTVRHVTIDDDADAIAAEIVRGAADADLVVVTGGLGPTEDDLTRAGLVQAMGDAWMEDPVALEAIRRWYEGRGQPMPEPNRSQAYRPRSGRCLPNDQGSAPGLAGRVHGADVYCLPGPPREMRPMFEDVVVPEIKTGRIVSTRFLRVFGLGESRVAEMLGDVMSREHNPLVGTTASVGLVTVRMRWEGRAVEEGDAALDGAEGEVRQLLGPAVVTPVGGDGAMDLQEVVVAALRARGERFASVESCTGGLVGSLVTEVAGSSDVFVGGWVTYANAMKAEQVGVPTGSFPEVDPEAPGAVSAEVCRAMAEGGLARARAGLDGTGVHHVLAITGIAGPGGGTPEKPVGTVWIGVASKGAPTECRRFEFVGDRAAVRRWAAFTALGMLWMRLAGVDVTPTRERERVSTG